MSHFPTPRFGLLLLLIAALAIVSGVLPFVAGPVAADNLPAIDKPGDAPKAPAARKPRLPTPPLKDLRLKDDEEGAEERILEALSKPTEVSFIDTPLEDAISFLKEQHKINIWIDRRALNDVNISTDQPVTLQIAEVRLESVLNLILDPLRLEWLIQDEVLKITTHAGATALADTRSFNVQNLLDAGHTPDELVQAIVQCVEPTTWIDAGGKGAISHSGGVLICRQTQRIQSAVMMLLVELSELAEEQLDESSGRVSPVVTLKVYHTREFPADELASTLKTLVAPDTWGTKGISVSAIKGALLVQQTAHVHREIERVLRQLLATGGADGDRHEETGRSLPEGDVGARHRIPGRTLNRNMKPVSRRTN